LQKFLLIPEKQEQKHQVDKTPNTFATAV